MPRIGEQAMDYLFDEENLTNDDMESRAQEDFTEDFEKLQTGVQGTMDAGAGMQNFREQLENIGKINDGTDDMGTADMGTADAGYLYDMLKEKLAEPSSDEDTLTRQQQLLGMYREIAAMMKKYNRADNLNDRMYRRHARGMMKLLEKKINELAIMEQHENLMEDNIEVGQPQSAGHAMDIRAWGQWLENTEKGGLGWTNSEYFQRVLDAIEKTAHTMDTGFDQNQQQNVEKLSQALGAFSELKEACERYTARKPRTKKGKIRREIVLQIHNFAERDENGCAAAIDDFLRMSPQEQSRETWMSVTQKARSIQLSVNDFSKLERPRGGQVSEVFKIPSEENENEIIAYFKKEDRLDVSGAVGQQEHASAFIALDMTLKKYPKLSKEDKESLREQAKQVTHSVKISEKGREAYEYWNQVRKKIEINVDQVLTPMGIVDEGGNVNMSRRNVASSRMADLLGLGDLLAKSQTVNLYDKASGQTIRGNLMDKAQGVERSEIMGQLTENKITSGFIRDTMNLQVLDMICGQVDRHAGNVLYQTNQDGEVTGMQGIDNDASFGTNTDAVAATVDLNRKDRRVFDARTGEMLVPYMDKQLADRIEAIDSSMIKYILSDLLREAEVNAAIRRFEVMKKGVTEAKRQHPERFLEHVEDWKMETVGEEIFADYEAKNQKMVDMMAGASEYFEDDPNGDVAEYKRLFEDPVNDFIMRYTDPQKFKSKYKGEGDREMKQLFSKINRYLGQKYGSAMNYFGSFMPARAKKETNRK